MAEILGTSAGTITQGQRKVASVASARIPVQEVEKLINVSEDIAPLTVMLDKPGKTHIVRAPTYVHYETDELPIGLTLGAAGQGSGVTTLALAANGAKRVTVNTLLLAQRTGEELRVTAVNTSANTVDVDRGVGGTSAAALNANEVISMHSFAAPDGDTSPESVTSEPTVVTNATQIFRASFEMSRRLRGLETYASDEEDRVSRDALRHLNIMREQTFLFGPGISLTDPTITGGVFHWLSTNVTNQAGVALTESGFYTIVQNWFLRNRNRDKMVLFAGENLLKAMDGFGRDVLRYTPDTTVLGVKVKGYQTAFGTIMLKPHGLMTRLGGDDTAANKGAASWAIGLNMERVGRAQYGSEGALTLNKDIQENDRDGSKAEWISDEGLWLGNEKAHCLVTGIP